MQRDTNKILEQINGVVGMYNSLWEDGNFKNLRVETYEELFTLMAHTLELLAPAGSVFERRARAIMDDSSDLSYRITLMAGILRALSTAYLGGYFASVQELIHADLFNDFLGRADHLLGEGYKDPAAVLAGGVLEEHLRKLCLKHTIPIVVAKATGDETKKASVMNDDLVKAVAYSKLDQKSVTAWLDLRNKAAHGRYTEYDGRHVEEMIRGVRNFVARFPA